MDHGSNRPRPSRDRHAYEVLTSGTARIRWLRIDLNVEARQAACSRQEEDESRDRTELNYTRANIGISGKWQHAKTPRPSQDCRSDAKGDYVGQRIQLAAEGTGGVSEARDATVEEIENNRNADCPRRHVEVPRGRRRPLNRLRDSVV